VTLSAYLVRTCGAILLTAGMAAPVQALSLDDISNRDASSGVRAALERGANTAVATLGVNNGFLGNPQVRIPLPPELAKVEGQMRMFGLGKQADELVNSMNHAAEQAVPQAKDVLIDAVKSMTLTDAKNILTGGDQSVTDFFKAKTRQPLSVRLLPIVKQATDRVGVAQQYNQVAAIGVRFGLMPSDSASIEQYVTGKTLDGLYLMIGQEEHNIRADPVGTGSALLSKVFGALK